MKVFFSKLIVNSLCLNDEKFIDHFKLNGFSFNIVWSKRSQINASTLTITLNTMNRKNPKKKINVKINVYSD